MKRGGSILTVENTELTNIPTGLRRVHIENVQSIADLTLDFEESGVYRLVGDNDVGKSAILRAINALFHNVSRSAYKEYISDWADTFVVEGWFYDGGYVKLSRGAVDFYEWNLPSGGNTLLKTDGKVPKELEDYFNLYTEKDKSKLTLNFNLQGDILPFVDTTASDNFWLTQKALGTNILLNANKLLKKENLDNQKLVKTTIDNIDYEMKISEKIANEIENDSYELEMLSDGVRVINEELEELESLYIAVDKENSLIELKNAFDEIPILSESEIGELYTKANEFSLIKKYYDYALKVENTQNKIQIIDTILSEYTIEDIYKEIELYNLMIKCKDKQILVNSLNDSLVTINNQIISDSELINCREDAKIIEKLKEFSAKMFKQNEFKEKYSNISSELELIEQEIIQLKEEEKICPLCGSDLLETIHTHK